MNSRDEIETVATGIVDALYTVHRELGPGLLESTYQVCLAHELRKRGMTIRCEVPMRVVYDGIEIDVGYRVDMLVEGAILVENKVVQALSSIHDAQLLTYLRLAGLKIGFLVNWNVPLIKHGIRRLVNGL